MSPTYLTRKLVCDLVKKNPDSFTYHDKIITTRYIGPDAEPYKSTKYNEYITLITVDKLMYWNEDDSMEQIFMAAKEGVFDVLDIKCAVVVVIHKCLKLGYELSKCPTITINRVIRFTRRKVSDKRKRDLVNQIQQEIKENSRFKFGPYSFTLDQPIEVTDIKGVRLWYNAIENKKEKHAAYKFILLISLITDFKKHFDSDPFTTI